MCNPNTDPSPTAIPAPDPPEEPPQPNLYLDLLSLKDAAADGSNPTNHKADDAPVTPEEKELLLLRSGKSAIVSEIKSLFRLASPIAATGIILYVRSLISMAFLGRLGDDALAGGSLAMAFANISGYSVLSGLALGMEPLCSQAFGARRPKLLSLTLHRTILFLLAFSIPISILWLNVARILIFLRQDPEISRTARTFLIFSLPDLLTNSFVHPIRIYLRAQGITLPLTLASLAGTVLHLPINLLLVRKFRLGVASVASAGAASNLFVLLSLIAYVWASGIHAPTWTAPSRECFSGWKPLLRLAAPSCASVCLEWWWYEIMILLCGLLVDPQSTVASMGILIQTTSFIYIFPSSLGFAVSTRVGNELGANRPGRARAAAAVSILLAFAMGAGALAFASGTRDLWGRFFSGDAEIRRLTAAALPILGLCELGNGPQTVACGVLRGTARPSKAANVNLSAFYAVGMPVAVGLGFGFGYGFRGLWLGLLAAQATCAALMLYVVGTTDWESQAERAQTLTCAGCVVTAQPDEAGGGGGDEKEPLLQVVVS